MNKQIESLIETELTLNRLDVYNIIYKGNNEFLVNKKHIFSFYLVEKCKNYHEYKDVIKSFIRLLKLNKLKNESDELFIGHLIYNDTSYDRDDDMLSKRDINRLMASL